MQGFQPFYTGSTLTQAARSAGEFRMQGARAMAGAIEGVGKSLGAVAGATTSYYADRPSEFEIKQADPDGKIFKPGERPSQEEFKRRTQGYGDQQRLRMQQSEALSRVMDAGVRLDAVREAQTQRWLGLHWASVTAGLPLDQYPGSVITSPTQPSGYLSNPAANYGVSPGAAYGQYTL